MRDNPMYDPNQHDYSPGPRGENSCLYCGCLESTHKLTPSDVDVRLRCGFTQAQAERRPGWYLARNRDDAGFMRECMELRDATGQVTQRMSVEAYKKEFTCSECSAPIENSRTGLCAVCFARESD